MYICAIQCLLAPFLVHMCHLIEAACPQQCALPLCSALQSRLNLAELRHLVAQVNVLGPFALTQRLRPLLLRATGGARVVTVASVMHRKAALPPNLDDFFTCAARPAWFALAGALGFSQADS